MHKGRLLKFKLADEEEYRRRLFLAASKGDPTAQEELRRTYHVRIYSASERATFACRNTTVTAIGRRVRKLTTSRS